MHSNKGEVNKSEGNKKGFSSVIRVIECLRLSSDGSGVGYDEGLATFVPGLLPKETGEIIIEERKKNWQRGKLIRVLQNSPYRVAPPCPVFDVCGGCQLQHLAYEQTLYWKTRWVEDALRRIGKLSLKDGVKPTIGMDVPWRYRNKARLHRDSNGKLGYYREKTNYTVSFPDCLLLSEKMNIWIRQTQELLGDKYPSVHTVTWRENSLGEGLVILENAEREEDLRMDILESKTPAWFMTGVKSVWGINRAGQPEHWWGQEYLQEEILGLKFKVSPLAFLQVNHGQTQKLYATVLEWAGLTGSELVWDLYSGIGTMTLALAKRAGKVWGIEENPYAVKDAWENSHLNNIKNVEFLEGKVEEKIGEIPEPADIVVLDPPRAGAHKAVIKKLLEVRPRKIIYVSCDPGTLARDVGLLKENYIVTQVQPFDMFPWTAHVECIVLIKRAESRMK